MVMANLPYTLHTDQIRPDQTKLEGQGEGTKLEPSAEIVGANLGNMVKFQLGVSKAFTAVGRGACLHVYSAYTQPYRSLSVQYIRPSVCPPAGDTQRLLTCW